MIPVVVFLTATLATAAPSSTPTPTIAPQSTPTAEPAAPTPTPTPTSSVEEPPPPSSDTAGAPSDEAPAPLSPPAPEMDLPIVETGVEELVGPPAPDEPVATVSAELTVKGKKKRKKAEKAALAGEVEAADKEWLAEVCPLEDGHGGTWLDRSQQRLGWGVCRATLWFDGLFGDERAILERDATYGYVQPKISWNEIDGVDPDVRFRAKINLPLADRRFNALLGRSNADEGPRRGSGGGFGPEQLPDSFREADDEWLLGLGYAPVRGNRRRLDFDAGVELSTPVEFFGQARLRRHWFLSPRDLVRFRQTSFWRTEEGYGVSLDIDYERVLQGGFVVRWRNAGTWAQHVEGLKWFDELTLFHRLGYRSALAYVLSANGETDREVTLDRYELEVIYRRNILREWLFVELRPGLAWRRPHIEDRREFAPFLGVGLEIQFGERDFE